MGAVRMFPQATSDSRVAVLSQEVTVLTPGGTAARSETSAMLPQQCW